MQNKMFVTVLHALQYHLQIALEMLRVEEYTFIVDYITKVTRTILQYQVQ